MRINFAAVQRNIADIAYRQEYTKDVLYELLAAYGRSASSITKLRNGTINLAENKDTSVLQRAVVYFKVLKSYQSLPAEVEKLEQDPLTTRYNPRFLIVTDLRTFAAKDTKKGNTLETTWENIDKNVDFFYGWTGDEKIDEKTEAAADRRAADKMKELYSEVEKVNLDRLSEKSSNFRHHLNVFFTRLLFCFFAEDAGVFSDTDHKLFTNAIKDYTHRDGSDLNEFLEHLFEVLDTEDKSIFTSPFSKFPYVNGSLFDKNLGVEIPKFNAQARKLILDCGAVNWTEINPDIFGSMFQSIVDDETRSTHGMHYTSVPNIMKTIEPLFLDELRAEFDKYFDNKSKLKSLWDRIAKIKIFDPACGSGNFLIIAYKELRKLEHAIIDRLFNEDYEKAALAGRLTSRIDLNNFFGIEIDDFACEVAVLSLYIAKHQMNIEFEKHFGKKIMLIPLEHKANIVHGNAAHLDWQEVCPNHPKKKEPSGFQETLIPNGSEYEQLNIDKELVEWEEIYLISNPPYLGSRNQNIKHKADLEYITRYYKSLDYIAIWFIKGADYIGDSPVAGLAFVSTNSIVQGEQVAILWPNILADKEISFAHTSFKWSNSARGNAGVTCVVIGLRNISSKPKYLITNLIKHEVEQINPYLTTAKVTYISRRSSSLSNLPTATFGSMPNDGGHLVLSREERDKLIFRYPEISSCIKAFVGAAELLKGITRYCLVISDDQLDMARSIPEISKRLELVSSHRNKSTEISTRKLAEKPNKFYFFSYKNQEAIVIPRVSSERRLYIPLGYVNSETVVSDSANVIYSEPWIFALLSSGMHMTWVRAVAGRLKTDFRYSSAIVYNNFPVSSLSDQQIIDLNNSAREILFSRENHSEKTLSEMYDPDNMPDDLREAHSKNDLLVDRLYRQKPYNTDEERLADLFELYEKMTKNEKSE